MSHTYWYNVTLDCLACGARSGKEARLHTSGLNPEAVDTWIAPGERLPILANDFEDAFGVVRMGGDIVERATGLEWWSCPVCGALQWACLEFQRMDSGHYRFVSARSVALEPKLVRAANFVTDELRSWIEANPGAEAERLRRALEGGVT